MPTTLFPARLRRLAPALVAALALWPACSGAADKSEPPSGTGSTATVQGATVEISDFKFSPAGAEVPAGASVTWTNRDTVLHTVTSGQTSGEKNVPDGLFEGQLDGAGETFIHQFDEPGTYSYYCSQHNVMTAKVTVL